MAFKFYFHDIVILVSGKIYSWESCEIWRENRILGRFADVSGLIQLKLSPKDWQ